MEFIKPFQGFTQHRYHEHNVGSDIAILDYVVDKSSNLLRRQSYYVYQVRAGGFISVGLIAAINMQYSNKTIFAHESILSEKRIII